MAGSGQAEGKKTPEERFSFFFLRVPTNLEDERRRGFELQHAGRTQRLEDGVRIVAEGLVDHHQGVDVVHVEADLVGTRSRLGESQLGVGHRGRQAHHHRVIVHRAVLVGGERGSRGRQETGVRMEAGGFFFFLFFITIYGWETKDYTEVEKKATFSESPA